MNSDPIPFDDLHATLRPRVIAYLTGFVGPLEAEDLAQEVFLKVHQGIGTFRGSSRLTTWVFQIATNAALDRLKSSAHKASRKQVPETLLEGEGHAIRDQASLQPLKDEMCRCIHGMVDELPVDYRTIIHLSELKELTLGEIAEVLGITPGAAKIRLHRARKTLRGRMEEQCRIILDEQAELQCDRRKDD